MLSCFNVFTQSSTVGSGVEVDGREFFQAKSAFIGSVHAICTILWHSRSMRLNSVNTQLLPVAAKETGSSEGT